MRRLVLALAAVPLAVAAFAGCSSPPQSATVLASESIVATAEENLPPAILGLYEAFNAHDSAAMAQFVSEDLAWYSVVGAEVSTEAAGREALIGGMGGYFEAVPDVRSSVEASMVAGSYVTVHERVRWSGEDDDAKSQSAVAVYELSEGLIKSVWYYPAMN